jgi:hypothetical protein
MRTQPCLGGEKVSQTTESWLRASRSDSVQALITNTQDDANPLLAQPSKRIALSQGWLLRTLLSDEYSCRSPFQD